VANATSVQLLQEGARNYVVKFDFDLDTSDLVATPVVDVQLFSQIFNDQWRQPSNSVRIDRIDYVIQDGVYVSLYWMGATDKRILDLAGRGMINVQPYGGYTNNSPAANEPNGSIDATTTGYAASTKVAGSITLWCVKMYNKTVAAQGRIMTESGFFIDTEAGGQLAQG
jgi:hypothetical protein